VTFATIVDARGSFRQVGGLAVGFILAAGVLMSYGITGGAMNPARAFGPQLADNHWTHGWVWYVGPLAGAVIAAAVYELVFLRPSASSPAAEPAAGDAAVS
jgi:glycerol uptake facilitator-like aquaporin